jgi:condensation domain-containing protein
MRHSSVKLDVLDFVNASTRNGHLSWGQRAIWLILRWEGAEAYRRNLTDIWEIPEGVAMPDVLAAFRNLLFCYETLRTTYADIPNGDPVQTVAGSGTMSVRMYEAPAEEIVEHVRTVEAELRTRYFDLATDIPIELGIVVVDGRPVCVVVVLSHLAVDGWSTVLMKNTFQGLLVDGENGPDFVRAQQAEQPIDCAEHEHSAVGRRSEERSLQFWKRSFEDMPTVMFQGQPETQVHPEIGVLHSHPLADAVASIVDRDGVSSSAVILGAAAIVLSSVLAEHDVAIRVLFATRFRPSTTYSVGALNLNGLFRITVAGGPGPDYFRRASTALIRAGRYSQCDPVRQNSELEAIMRERGVDEREYVFFSDLSKARLSSRELNTPGVASYGASPCCDGLSRYERKPDARVDRESKFLLKVHRLADVAEIEVYLDRSFFPGIDSLGFLSALERVLVAGARQSDEQHL